MECSSEANGEVENIPSRWFNLCVRCVHIALPLLYQQRVWRDVRVYIITLWGITVPYVGFGTGTQPGIAQVLCH